MATIVKGDLYDRLDGKLHEIKRQMRQKDGYGFDPERLDLALQAIVEGRFEAVGGQFPSVIYAPELIPEYTDGNGNKRKWDILEDVAPSTFDISKLKKPRSFLKGETRIGGEQMRQRAVEFKGNLGLSDGKRMLAEQDKIPFEFRDFYIPLPGTLLRDSSGDLCVPYLGWYGGRWILDFYWLGHDWGGNDRFACSE